LVGLSTLIVTATATASAASEVLDRIVAVVNEDIILLSELNQRMAPYSLRIREQKLDSERERRMLFQIREEMLNRLVDEKLTDQEVQKNDIKISEEEINKTIERIKATNAYTDEELRNFLDREQLTMDQYRDSIKNQILRTRLVNMQVKSKIVITNEEIQDYYDSHPELYGGKLRYRLKNILMRIPAFALDDEKEEVRKKMEQLRSRIEQGEDFSELARIYSQGPTALQGGDIGEFEESMFSPQIQQALKGLEPGEATSVLDTDQGYQLFYVDAIDQLEGIPLETVKDDIHETLFNEVVDKQFLSWLEDLRGRSHIKIVN
jgi:peptidyl-prolyl cis-trans isomerase SurA